VELVVLLLFDLDPF